MSVRQGMIRFGSTFLVAAVMFRAAIGAQAQELRVAAAADLKFALSELAAQYEKRTGTKVNATYGSSGNFFAQIQNGAPFDLFFSADMEYPRKLQAAGLAEPETLYKYALGRIVIRPPADADLDGEKREWDLFLDACRRTIGA